MSKIVAIVQSNYIPWKGYFDLIDSVEQFVLLDDVQFTRRDWRNRNKIKTANGLNWLTIPVIAKGRYFQTIAETKISNQQWAKTHWSKIETAYRDAPAFEVYKEQVESWYLQLAEFESLSKVNHFLLTQLCQLLSIDTQISNSNEFELVTGKTERLCQICKDAGADVYLSGPAAKDYMDESVFADAGIEVKWMDYSGYKEYPQLFGDFEHGVSILDVLFNCGEQAREFVLSKP